MKAPRMGPRHLASPRYCSAALCFVMALVCTSPVVAAPASKAAAHKSLSQSLTGSAKADFEAAKMLASDGDYANALIKFQSAYDASQDPRLLWNVAFCHKNARHYAKVIFTLKRYIDEGASVLSANDKKEAQELIALIEPFTTRANFQVSETGAKVFVDDELVGVSPLAAPVVLDIGERRLRVTKEGCLNFEKTLAIGGSNEVTVEVALQKEVHEGKLIVNAPPNASILLDGKPIATGKFDQAIASGGHQIRVTAPGMHPFQTEVVIQDKETRSLDVALESLAPAEKPKLRVAVGCTDSEPKAPEDGLVVYIDGPDVLPSTSIKRKWSEEEKKNVVEWVEYTVAPGPHRLRIIITDCRPDDVTVNVDVQKGADVTGALQSDRFILSRGPVGSPGLGRVGLGLFMPLGDVRDRVPERYRGDFGGVVGATVDLGLVARWFGVFAQASFGKGSFARDSYATHYALPEQAKASWSQFSLRLGPRFPFHSVALGLGIEFGMQQLNLNQVRTGVSSGISGVFTELDIQPFCDFGLFSLAKVEKPLNDDKVIGSLSTGLYYQPSSRCRRERATVMGLRPKGP
jgi:hypothetical protein